MLRFLLLLTFLFFQTILFSQEWAPVGTTWWYQSAGIFTPNIFANKVESIGDTLINNQECKIIQADLGGCDMISGEFYMYNQNDTIWYYQPFSNKSFILYIFSAQPGDSWEIAYQDFLGTGDTTIVTVDSIYNMEINGVSLRALDVIYEGKPNSVYEGLAVSGTIVETIGDFKWGLFSSNMFNLTICDGLHNRLRCFENDTLGLKNFTGIPCDSSWVINSTSELIPTPNKVILYPNPTSDILNLAILNFDLAPLFRYEISDLTGKKIISEEKIVSGNPNYEIDVNHLSSGLYVLSIYIKDRFWKSEKFVVIK